MILSKHKKENTFTVRKLKAKKKFISRTLLFKAKFNIRLHCQLWPRRKGCHSTFSFFFSVHGAQIKWPKQIQDAIKKQIKEFSEFFQENYSNEIMK
ncbi:hypothetical protein BpHYR1_045373 [Brachionus plicatilis]|uniref:Uncharacterized protein n=1 Tax=Brachionus plicatilis TaxID=10195 RepID=A0A3M7QXA7_BRAPC|nr:hypothetical protein BpHYR1_045373 [Brachionus plicatilis]